MKSLLFLFFFLNPTNLLADGLPFRLHLNSEPTSLDPNRQRNSSSGYLLGNLYRNIYKFDNGAGLQNELGDGCQRDNKGNLICKLKKNLRWSDGSPLTGADFLRTYAKMLNPKNSIPRADLLFSIKNARAIYLGTKSPDQLGVRIRNEYTIIFEFEKNDPQFEYSLSSFVLAPTKADLSAYSGPYSIKEWKKGQKLILEPNLSYPHGSKARPKVEFLFIEEDTIALQLYEKNELQFLRRLPTIFIPRYKGRPDFHSNPVIRFDYIGFGPRLANREDLRKALSYSLKYKELQKVFSSKGQPGCFGLPKDWFPSDPPCIKADMTKIPKLKEPFIFHFYFSALGGEDHKVATEWLQNQWAKNIGAKVLLEIKENKVFLQNLTEEPPELFRKGVSPDRPTCLSALETFESDSSENFIRLRSNNYDTLLRKMREASDQKEVRKLCLSGAEYLLKNHLIIPLGPIEFSLLAKPQFRGWKLNKLNELDLSNLTFNP
jgi:oligopeptide transport system substrate-binding protein